MALQQPSLPPGVYFSPTREDSLDLLNRWIGGDGEMPDARGFVFQADVYGASPDALRRMHPPASTRAGQHTWWFLGETRLRSRRARCGVDGGGCWRLEQSKENQKTPWAEGGFKDGFVFYLGPSRKERTPWLMQEITSARHGGARKQGAPALHRVYVTPHATDDELRGIYGEDGVTVGPDGNKKPVRATVPAEHFDGIAALLPPESVRDLGQENVQPAPSGLLDYYGQQVQNFVGAASPAGVPRQYLQQHGQFFEADVLGQYLQQHGQFFEADVLGQYLQQHGQFLEADVLGQFQQQHGQFLEAGALGRQQGGFLEAGPPPPPPAAPGLLAEVGADPPPDNLSMIMAEFMAILNEGSAKGEPA